MAASSVTVRPGRRRSLPFPRSSSAFAVVFVFAFVLGVGAAVPAHAATLRGTVVDTQGHPVAAVRVDVVGPLGARHVYTDASGTFSVVEFASRRLSCVG